MKILGIDPGSRITGYGLILKQGSEIKALDYGCIRPPATLSFEQRLLFIFEGVTLLVETHHPDAVAVELQFVLKNVQSAIKLGMAKAMALLAAARKGIPVHEYAPMRAKRAVVGKGQASKWQVQRMIQTILRLPSLPEPEDAADALALALCHAHEEKKQEWKGTVCTNRFGAFSKKKVLPRRLSNVEGSDIDCISH